MLRRIVIRNLVIMRELDIAFGDGMTALTGETGAGKSILIDAVGLALGDKADNSMIRTGNDRAEISVQFELDPGAAALAWLRDRDLDDDGDCLLRRVLVRHGRSRAYVNGTLCPIGSLRELGEQLIDIHGQHAHQSLLRPAAQRELLDAFAGLTDQVRALGSIYQQWQQTVREIDALRTAADERERRLEFLAFQVDELDDLDCDPHSIRQLDDEQARLAHADRLRLDSGALLDLLATGEPALRDGLHHAVATLAELTTLDHGLAASHDLLEEAALGVDEAVASLRRYQERIEVDPLRLQQVDDTLAQLHDVARKHRVAPANLEALRTRLHAEMATLRQVDERLDTLERERDAREAAYRKASTALSGKRRSAARRLSKTVTNAIRRLAMGDGVFEVRCAPCVDGVSGSDQVGFSVAVNAGQAAGTLAAVASGGELSRISLAIQVASARCGSIPTLVFDEVDVGIGGATAAIVGELLRQLGRERQILCVTHLAQVASQADHQLAISKRSNGQETETCIVRLDPTQRVDEIARMLGGVEITEKTRHHAQEMIGQAHPTPPDP